MPLRFLVTALFISLLSFNVFAATCLDVFPDFTTAYGSQLIIPSPPFQSGNNSPNYSSDDLSLSEGAYQGISVTNGGVLNLTSVDGTYFINNLNANPQSTLNFSAGDYYINNLELASGSEIKVIGSGTVRIYVLGNLSIQNNVVINYLGTGQLIFIRDNANDTNIGQNLNFTGVMYSKGNINFQGGFDIYGAITAKKKVTLSSSSDYVYDSAIINAADFNGMCDASPLSSLELHYLFNEGSGQDVTDSSGNNRDATLGDDSGISLDPSWQCESTGAYLTFEASDSDSDRIETDSLISPTETTISFWMKVPEIPSETQRIFGMDSGWEARWASAKVNGNTNDGYIYFDINYDSNDSDNTEAIRTATRFTSSDVGKWFHLAFTGSKASGKWKIYINGGLDNGNSNESGNGNADNLIFDRPSDSEDELWLGGSSWKTNGESFTGSLDDFRLYRGLLSDSEITALAANSPQPCEPTLELHYLFDEGSGQLAADSSGNNRDATLGDDSGISLDPLWQCESTGAYLTFEESDSDSDRIETNSFSPPTETTISFWMKVPEIPTSTQRIFGMSSTWESRWGPARENGNTKDGYVYFDINFDDNSSNDEDAIRTATRFTDADVGKWFHLAFTGSQTTGKWKVYINGELDNGNSNESSNGNTNNITFNQASNLQDNLWIGGSSWKTNGESFTGSLDDFRLYNGLLDDDEIEVLAETPPQGCLNHYEIYHDLTGLTCEAEEITVKACTNEIGSTCIESTEDVNLTLNAVNTQTVSKNLDVTGNITTNMSYTTAETITLSISGESIDATNGFVCIGDGDTANNSCQITFADAGFRFIANNSENLPIQLSGKPSDTGYNEKTWALQAIRKNTSTGACESALSGSKSINLRATCTSPDSCAGETVTINSSGVPTESLSSTPSYASVNLSFDTDSIAEFTFQYPDAGQLTLQAQYTIPKDTSVAGSTDLSLEGTSNTFIVKPFGFHVASTGNPAAENASSQDSDGNSTIFVSAGTSFDVNITAKQWKSGNDSNTNGINDDGDDISENGNTSNFNHVINLERTLVAPSVSDGGTEGTLSVTNNQGSNGRFNNGVATLTANYSEVGIIELLASNESGYIETDVTDIKGSEPFVGRFVPDYFKQTVESKGELKANWTDTCPSSYPTSITSKVSWAYAGQEKTDFSGEGLIYFYIEPSINITAYNALGDITENYTVDNSTDNTKDFMKLTAEDVHAGLGVPTSDETQLRVGEISGGGTVAITSNMVEGTLDGDANAKGVMTYTYSGNDHFIYEHNANSQLSPFWAEIPFAINTVSDLIRDSDDVTLPLDNTGTTLAGATEDFIVGGEDDVQIYFGRWYIENSFGPETSSLVVPMTMQYYDEASNSFLTNTRDQCIIPSLGDITTSNDVNDLHNTSLNIWEYLLIDVSGDIANGGTTSGTNGSMSSDSFTNGIYRDLVFNAPNERGKLFLEYEVPDWFKYNWLGATLDASGEYTNNPTATIVFGLYRSNDRIISWREVNN